MQRCDLAIIGAGPAGMAAAAEAAQRGLSVTLLDEQNRPGGQIYRDVDRAGGLRGAILGQDYLHGMTLTENLHQAGITHLPGAVAWAIEDSFRISFTRQGRAGQVEAERVILATGALERPMPVPGWTMPGVMTAGAAQILLKQSGVLPRRAVLAGCGPLLYLIAAQMVRAGTPPLALVETQTAASPLASARHLPGCAARLALSGQGPEDAGGDQARRRAALYRCNGDCGNGQHPCRGGDLPQQGAGSPHHLRYGAAASRGGAEHAGRTLDRGAACLVRRASVLCAGNRRLGRDPQGRCSDRRGRGRYQRRHGRRVRRADRGVESGRGAGPDHCARARPSGRAAVPAAPPGNRGAPFLDAAYPPYAAAVRPADSTIVCRCEEVTAGDIRSYAGLGCLGPNQAKAFGRAGMGPCQGRYCGLTVTALLAEANGQTPDETGYYRIRPPIKPVTLGELAAMEDPSANAAE